MITGEKGIFGFAERRGLFSNPIIEELELLSSLHEELESTSTILQNEA